MEKALEINDLIIGYHQSNGSTVKVAGPLTLSMGKGQLNCLIGPNGVGKSTLLRTIAAIQPALTGDIRVMGISLKNLKGDKLSRLMSIVLTERITHGNLKAIDVVSMGRTPYTGWFGSLDGKDHEVISRAIEMTSIGTLLHKNMLELSDGERQKVMITRALAQDTQLILLDEPTAHLDLPNRIEIAGLLRKLAADSGKAIIMSTHELDLALQAADNIWLMAGENTIYNGTPEDLVLSDVFGKTFTRDGIDFDINHGIFRLIEPHDNIIAIRGENPGWNWTKRALERHGYNVVNSSGLENEVLVECNDGKWEWTYRCSGHKVIAHTIGEMLQQVTGKEMGYA